MNVDKKVFSTATEKNNEENTTSESIQDIFQSYEQRSSSVINSETVDEHKVTEKNERKC